MIKKEHERTTKVHKLEQFEQGILLRMFWGGSEVHDVELGRIHELCIDLGLSWKNFLLIFMACPRSGPCLHGTAEQGV